MKVIELVETGADAEQLLVVDVANLAFRALHAINLTTTTNKISSHIHGSIGLLGAFLKNDVKPRKTLICYAYEGEGAKKRRREFLPTYKDRPKGDFNPLPDVEALFKNMPGKHLRATSAEADDIIAHVAKNTAKDVIILSGDKDLWHLMTKNNVSVFSPNYRRYVTHEDLVEKFHVSNWDQILLSKSLYGDSSDTIKGVDRLFKKHVQPILDLGVTTVDDFYKNILPTTPKNTKVKLLENRNLVETNFKVVEPFDITLSNCFEMLHVGFWDENKAQLRQDLLNWECNQVSNDFLNFFYGEPMLSNLRE